MTNLTGRCGRRFMKYVAAVAWLFAALLSWQVSPASGKSRKPALQPPPPVTADHHSKAGTQFFDSGRFEEAISEYRKAYELEDRPEFLFDIARAYERLGNQENASHFYRRFLATKPPDSPQRSQAELATAEAPAPPSPAAPPQTEQPMLPPSLVYHAEPHTAEPPIFKRWWFWAGLGAVLVTGVAVGIAAFAGDSSDAPPSDLGHKRLK